MMHKLDLDMEKIRSLYLKKTLSTGQISDLFGCSDVTIINRLKELDIKRINNSGKKIKYKRKDFSSNKVEKAYLIGFRLGDLNVYETKETVVARCHTTDRKQVILMGKLFRKYGGFKVSVGSSGYNINCFLNKTFSFLLPKDDSIPSWVFKNPQLFYPFVAGYIDAEGNFIISQGRARFKVDSYDVGILRLIAGGLVRDRIRAKFRIIGSKESGWNSDLWRLNINEAQSLMKFMLRVKRYLKHGKRLKDMCYCISNIKRRIKNGTVTV